MQRVETLPEVAQVLKNESCALAIMSLAQDGRFTMNEIAVYSNVLAFSYFGANLRFLTAIEKGEASYSEVVGTNYNDYKKLRTKLRKVGLMTYSVGKHEWMVRNPVRLFPAQQKKDEPAKKTMKARVITSAEGSQQLDLRLVAA